MSNSTRSAWWQLLRAGNVLTAVSNILAGFLLVRGDWQPVLPLVFLILASACLYLSGMVLNDVFDLEVDRAERPERPLPSGRIDPKLAMFVGWGLMFDGLTAAGIAAWLLESWLPIGVAALLAGAIVAYDAWLKNTKLGPLSMGLCRSLNVLLGASALVTSSSWSPVLLYSASVGIYTAGLTLFASDEAGVSQRRVLLAAGWVCKSAILLLLFMPTLLQNELRAFHWLVGVALCLALAIPPINRATLNPSPKAVQQAVSRLIVLFILLDAVVCDAVGDWPAALTVLALLIPTYIATRRTPMT